MKKFTDKDIEDYRVLTKCLVECTSIEHLKVLLDLHGMKYSRDSELEFLKWINSLICDQWCSSTRLYDTPSRSRESSKIKFFKAKDDRRKQLETKVGSRKKCNKRSILKKTMFKHAKKHIDELKLSLVISWLRASLQNEKRRLSSFKRALLSIWMDKHGSELCLKTRS